MPEQFDLRLTYLAQEGRCFYCGTPLPPSAHRPKGVISEDGKRTKHDRKGWTKDHFRPAADGHHGTADNVVLACQPCNVSKDRRYPSNEERHRFAELQLRVKDLRTQAALDWLAPPEPFVSAPIVSTITITQPQEDLPHAEP